MAILSTRDGDYLAEGLQGVHLHDDGGPRVLAGCQQYDGPTTRAKRVTIMRDAMPALQSKCSISAICYDFHTRVSR